MNKIPQQQQRLDAAVSIAHKAADTALALFRNRDELQVEVKGLQDWVSNADRSVEDEIRAALLAAFPDDGIIGEEHGRIESRSGYTWVIDPIDGTTNFVNGSPGWCVVIACVHHEQLVIGVIRDPLVAETYTASRGQGATLNGKPMQVSTASSLQEGTVGVGHSTRVSAGLTVSIIDDLLGRQGMFARIGSGALSLAYVAAGRYIGYCEPQMNAWDCVAALLMIEEAGGKVQPYAMSAMLEQGGRVVAAGPGLYDELTVMTDRAYSA